MRIVSFLLAAWLSAAPASDFSRITFGCAPWDGSALDILIGSGDRLIKAHVWGRGMERLRGGAGTLALDNVMSSQGTGHGSLCPPRGKKGPCKPEKLRFQFSTFELKPGGRFEGTVSWEGGPSIPFKGSIDPKSRSHCG